MQVLTVASVSRKTGLARGSWKDVHLGGKTMPTVAIVDGIKIQFYHDEHPPPHFHAEFAEYQAKISIETLKVVKGRMPRPQLRKVLAWATPRRALLFDAWEACEADRDPGRIP